MYERMLDKTKKPADSEIKEFIGETSYGYMELIKSTLQDKFDLGMEIKFPFGNNYGWSYKVSHKSKHLFYIFFEKGSITVTTKVQNPKTDREIQKLEQLSDEGKKYWENKYPCSDGGWIHYRILKAVHLHDIGIFLSLRTGKEIIF